MKNPLKISFLLFFGLGLSVTLNAQVDASPKMMKAKKYESTNLVVPKPTNLELKVIEITQINQEILNSLKRTDSQKYNSLIKDLQKIASLENDLIICKKEGKNQKYALIKAELQECKHTYNLK